jgi:predicted histone-like DNA-binding protein
MKVLFKSIKRVNPQDQSDQKYYATIKSKELISFDELILQISDGSSLRESDIRAAVTALLNVMIKQLTAGRSIQLGDLGNFSLGINSDGVVNEEEVNASLIKRVKIRYRATAKLKRKLKSLHFIKAE